MRAQADSAKVPGHGPNPSFCTLQAWSTHRAHWSASSSVWELRRLSDESGNSVRYGYLVYVFILKLHPCLAPPYADRAGQEPSRFLDIR